MNSKPSARIKMEATQHDVPQSLPEVSDAVAAIGRAQRERQRIEAEMNDGLAAIRAKYEALGKPHADAIGELTHGVKIYCEAHRDELTKDGKTKTAKLAAGEISWRTRPPSVAVRAMGAVVEALKKLKLDRYLRTKVEVDKEAVLADPDGVDGVKGISISQKEDFVIKPFLTELEEVR